MRKMKTAALAVLLASCGLARADVFDKLPADALVVGRVANLGATSNKIAKLAKDLGIDAFVAPLQNPLAAFKAQTHFDKGVKDDGDIGFAYMDPKEGPADDSMIILVPVSNYAEFITNWPDAKTDGAITTFNDDGKDLNVADWNGYAAISPSKELLSAPTATIKLAAAATKEAGRQDFLVVANFKTLAPKILPKLDDGQAKITEELDKAEGDKIDAKYKPLIKVALAQVFNAARGFVNGSDNSSFGLNISDAGINTTLLGSFTPDSYPGKLAAKLKNTDKPLTIGLPAMKFLAYGGSIGDPVVGKQIFDDFASPIIAELNKIEGLDNAKKLVNEATAAIAKTTGTVFALPAPTKLGQEGLIQQVTIYHGGGEEFKTLFTDGGAVAKQFIADMNLPADRPKPTLETVQNAKSIEGVNFDTIKFEAKPNPDAPGAAQQEAIQNLFNGPNGMVYSYGTSGQDLILSQGASDETIAAFIKSSKANEDNISKLDQVKVVAAELPKARMLEYYVALDEMVNAGVAAAAQFNLPVQVQLPPDLPPLGVTLSTEGSTVRIDSHLPTATVQSLIAAGMQAFMGMRQGGGNL